MSFPCSNTRDVPVKFYITYIITLIIFLKPITISAVDINCCPSTCLNGYTWYSWYIQGNEWKVASKNVLPDKRKENM